MPETQTDPRLPWLDEGEQFMVGSFTEPWNLLILVHRHLDPERWGVHKLYPVSRPRSPEEIVNRLAAGESLEFSDITRWAHSCIGLQPMKPHLKFTRNTELGEVVDRQQVAPLGMSKRLRDEVIYSVAPLEWQTRLAAGDREMWSRIEVWG